MTRIRNAAVCSVLVAAVLSGCGGGTDTPARAPASPADPPPGVDVEPTPSPAPSPSVTPGPGSYPAFASSDYTYTLSVGCFCADGGVPITITVVDGEVNAAVYAGSGGGVKEADPVPPLRRLTINDIIDAANDGDVASVDVTWPEGQAFPSEVSIDRIARAVDDEITYTLSAVDVD